MNSITPALPLDNKRNIPILLRIFPFPPRKQLLSAIVAPILPDTINHIPPLQPAIPQLSPIKRIPRNCIEINRNKLAQRSRQLSDRQSITFNCKGDGGSAKSRDAL